MLCVFEKREREREREKRFGPDFLQWVRVLMSDTRSCVNYCGWLSDFFYDLKKKILV